jgi:replicative DNA helicase
MSDIMQNIETEKSLLGQILSDPTKIHTVRELLKPEHFTGKNRLIYQLMLELNNNSIPIDSISLYEKSKRDESVLTVVDISELQNQPYCNVETAKRIIYEKYVVSALKQFSKKIISTPDSKDPFEIIEEAETEFFNLTQGAFKKSFMQLKDINAQTINNIQKIKSKGIDEFIINTGFVDLDDLLGGFMKTDLIILAARPSMGKTALALSMAKNMAEDDFGVGIFSLEMGNIQLSARLMALECEIPINRILRGKFSDSESANITRAVYRNDALPIFIDDTGALDIFELRSKAKRLVSEKDVKIIFVDYLQLVSAKADSREQQVSLVSRNLKAMAKELNIPVVALSQLNRSLEARTQKKPQLSDLRESGAIEQDADIVMFIHRPEVYGITKTENGMPTENLAQVIVSKNRNGSIGDINLTFIKEKAKFESYSTMSYREAF